MNVRSLSGGGVGGWGCYAALGLEEGARRGEEDKNWSEPVQAGLWGYTSRKLHF